MAADGSKLAGAQMNVDNFARWGYPSWFMYVVGLIEVAGAILLFIPKTRFYGAALLVVDMVGAVFTHIQSSEPEMIPVPFVLLVLSAIIAWANRPDNIVTRSLPTTG